MKPHIKMVRGLWACGMPNYDYGQWYCGAGPVSAYQSWHEIQKNNVKPGWFEQCLTEYVFANSLRENPENLICGNGVKQ